jgi:hypothetical protein
MNSVIEKRVELKAPVSRVWRALTDYREFGEWFRVKLDGPFVPGQVSRGQITYPGYEHVKNGRRSCRKWSTSASFPSPGPIPSPSTRRMPHQMIRGNPPRSSNSGWIKTANGTLLVLTESGFDKLPGDRRLEAFRRNDGGWAEQMKNIESHVSKNHVSENHVA